MQKDNRNQPSTHANTDELLDYLNDEQRINSSATKSAHIRECDHCQAELNALSTIGPVLFNHVDEKPRDEVWERLQRSLYSGTSESDVVTRVHQAEVYQLRPSVYQSLSKSIYALAASVAFVGVIGVFMFSQQQSNNQQTQRLQASINELMTNSRGLEQSLQTVALQNRALSDANQRVADRLYWKLTYVDQLIHEAAPEDSERVKTLWNDRVEALNELRQIYFERDSARETSEI